MRLKKQQGEDSHLSSCPPPAILLLPPSSGFPVLLHSVIQSFSPSAQQRRIRSLPARLISQVSSSHDRERWVTPHGLQSPSAKVPLSSGHADLVFLNLVMLNTSRRSGLACGRNLTETAWLGHIWSYSHHCMILFTPKALSSCCCLGTFPQVSLPYPGTSFDQ